MRNFKIHIDLLDLQEFTRDLDLTEFNECFMIYFVEADNPDDAIHTLMYRIKFMIMDADESMRSRITCKLIKYLMRVERIESL